LGASVGIAIFFDDGHDAEALLQSADRALYRAKTNGKNGSKSADTARRAKGTGVIDGARIRSDRIAFAQLRVASAYGTGVSASSSRRFANLRMPCGSHRWQPNGNRALLAVVEREAPRRGTAC